MALPNADFSADLGKHRFFHDSQTYDVNWQSADETDAQFFRPHEGLGKDLIGKCEESLKGYSPSDIPVIEFCYQSDGLGQYSDVRSLIGQSGELVVEKLIFSMTGQRIEHLVIAGITDSGQPIKAETIDRLLLQPGQKNGCTASLRKESELIELLGQEDLAFEEQTNRDLESYYEEETEKLERWAEDRRLALDVKTKQLDNEIKVMRKANRQLELWPKSGMRCVYLSS